MNVRREERAAAWLARAHDDLDFARSAAETVSYLARFHCQQASGKALKAVITSRSGDAPVVHDARRLLEALTALAAPASPEVAEAANSLDKYYVGPRYPDAIDFADARLLYGPREARRGIEDAELVLRWCDE
ncbi:MAG: HEPN domain-containing protein [Vulcanimicrobiaceae bacterium]